MRTFQLIALTPPGLVDPSIAIAASRAGELGVLDLEYARDEEAALAAIRKLARYAKQACGIKLKGGSEELVSTVMPVLPKHVEVVMLTFTDPECLQQQVRTLRQRDLTVLLETTSLEQALLGPELEVDGLIAKGNEAGGWVGEESTFILLQQLLTKLSLPVWAQGGIGLHTVAACYVAGAAGVVLDTQLALTRESPLPEGAKAIISRMDGSETICLGEELGAPCRVYARPALRAIEVLNELERTLMKKSRPRDEILESWCQEIRTRVGWASPEQHLWLLGQDAAFAAPLAHRFQTVGGVLQGMRQAIDEHVRSARSIKPLDERSSLARSHGTRYPVAQGPMTRVSDRASFAAKVAETGALPFLALGLMRGSEVKILLEETSDLIGDLPWGVGILGFVPLDLRQEQLEAVLAYRPAFAIIAGGRPDQAQDLEHKGIPTYLHVPSPELLKIFLRNGARRFIFEGRECGGHVGPRSSFVLWNSMTDVLLESLSKNEIADCHVLFAGGIHNALSSSMVATIVAPLVERDVKVGVLVGTAYLFTEEAVATGAILKGFQQEAIKCVQTTLLESGPGHAVRCAITPYAKKFKQVKQRLSREAKSAEEIRADLENLNLGRLLIASRGIERNPQFGKDPQAQKFVTVGGKKQRSQGLYMIGQAAAFRDRTCTMEELHREISVKGTQRLIEQVVPSLSNVSNKRTERPSDIAIIGMACIVSKAPDLHTYWENILNKVDAITEVPPGRWDWRLYYDPDSSARDRIYSRWGGFLDPIPFDPLSYGMPPNAISSIEPVQLLTLETVRTALQDAGYAERPFPRERTSVIIGAGGGVAELGLMYSFRSNLPLFFKEVPTEVLCRLPEWTEDSFPGILPNVIAGRVANRFDLEGVNYTIDAACAASTAALHTAVKELETGNSDMVIVGGVDTCQSPLTYLCFSKTMALSPTGRCRSFDETADGTTIAEGVAMLVIKRLADAERDGDRIYAVIKGVGASSDGRGKSLTAPRPEGQALALERAYAKAGVSPSTVGLIEAHGTGTVAGDRAEIETLRRVFETDDVTTQRCAIGSVKSMIGHTKCAAGALSLIKVALALHHKVLPATIGVKNPNSSLAGSPFYVNTEMRPWMQGTNDHPRRAGVSGFGFGGSNFHAVLEEYTGGFLESTHQAVCESWPSELLIWTGRSRKDLLAAVESMRDALEQGARPCMRDLAYTLWRRARDVRSGLKLAVVAVSIDDLRQKLSVVREALVQPESTAIQDPRGIYFTEQALVRRGEDGHNGEDGKIAFIFSGQGSQYPNMVRDLAVHFCEVRKPFEVAERVLADSFPEPLRYYVFPPPCFSEKEEEACVEALTQTNIAQPAVGAAGMGLFRLLRKFGVNPDMVAGHSYGEYVALCAAGVFSERALYAVSETRGRIIMEAAGQDLGTMAAVEASRESVVENINSIESVWVSNLNAPKQTIISGTHKGVAEAVRVLRAKGIRTTPIAVSCAFHSPLMVPVQERLAEFLETIEFGVPKLETFSNTYAAPYPHEPKAIGSLLIEHLVRPVEFINEIEAMYQSGTRVFVEVGPRSVLTSLTQQILGERPHLAVTLDIPGRSGITQLQHVLGQLIVHGVSIQADLFYEGRKVQLLDLENLAKKTGESSFGTSTWMVNGQKAWPLKQKVEKKPLPEISEAEKPYPVERQDVPKHAPQAQSVRSTARPQESGVLGGHQQSEAVFGQSTTDGEVDRAMARYQQLMNRFLDVQHEVMMAYLAGEAEEVPSDSKSVPSPEAVLGEPEIAVTPTSVPPGSPANATIPVPPEVPPSAERQQNREQLTTYLVKIVSERTGYPAETLDLDLDLEADLGIDSIKRVEILGTLQQGYAPLQQQEQQAMEELTKIKTMRGIIDWIIQAVGVSPEDQTSGDIPLKKERTAGQIYTEEDNHEDTTELQRFMLTAEDVSSGDRPLQIESGSVFLITDDEGGVARAVADEIRRLGGTAVLVRMGDEVGEADQDHYTADLTDPDAVDELLKSIRKGLGSITGIIHLLPLKAGTPFEKMKLEDWRTRLRLEVKGLFYLAKAASQDLRQAAGTGESFLIAATAMGGSFASAGERQKPFFPGYGGIAGLVKTLAVEWSNVECKVVDFDPDLPASTLAGYVIQEMASGNGVVEVGYKDSSRLILRLTPAPLDYDNPAGLAIDSDWVVLVTGGARGITAEVALELAERYHPTLLLVGRSSLPEAEESPETYGLNSPQEIKKALIEKMRESGQEFTLAQIENRYKQICREREIRRNIVDMEKAGARVKYYPVNVCDEQAFGDLIEEVYSTYGRLDGCIHGAGVIEDKLVEDKLPGSFDHVFDTKVESAFILTDKLRSESLRFLVLFSSVAGRFGNRGQSDYAAANEVLNKLAVYLDGQWPGRIVAINWGPWAKAGMVADEVQRQFAQRGVHLIRPAEGRLMFNQELSLGPKGQVEVCIAGMEGVNVEGEWSSRDSKVKAFPLLAGVSSKFKRADDLELIRTLDLEHDVFLKDHQLDGKPVLPMAVAMELIAEVVQQGWPKWEVTSIQSLRVLKGIILNDRIGQIRITAQPKTVCTPERDVLEVDTEITELDRPDHPCYHAVVQMEKQLPAPPRYDFGILSELNPFSMSVSEACERWLFQGPFFQGISSIDGVNDHGICGLLIPSSPAQAFVKGGSGKWLIDPVLVDSSLQLAILWERAVFDMTPLPSHFSCYRRFGSPPTSPVQCYVHTKPSVGGHILVADIYYVDNSGRVIGVLEQMESSCTKELNRLTESFKSVKGDR